MEYKDNIFQGFHYLMKLMGNILMWKTCFFNNEWENLEWVSYQNSGPDNVLEDIFA